MVLVVVFKLGQVFDGTGYDSGNTDIVPDEVIIYPVGRIILLYSLVFAM